jgi:hypothetical protein
VLAGKGLKAARRSLSYRYRGGYSRAAVRSIAHGSFHL